MSTLGCKTEGESSLAFEMNTLATSRCSFAVSNIGASHRKSLTWYANKRRSMLSITFAVSRAANPKIGADSHRAIVEAIHRAANGPPISQLPPFSAPSRQLNHARGRAGQAFFLASVGGGALELVPFR